MGRIAGAALGLVLIAACSSSSVHVTSDASDSNRASDATGLAECSWPVGLAGTDASTGQCRGASRTLLSCVGANGVRAIGLSDNTTEPRLDGISVDFGGTWTCQMLCDEKEYAIVCGSIGPSDTPEPTVPAGCGRPVGTTGGPTFYCCPCGA